MPAIRAKSECRFWYRRNSMAQSTNDESLNGTNVAILVADGFEQVEMTGPRAALESAGATTRIISSRRGKVQGFNHDAEADQFDVDLAFDEAYPQDFDAVLLPGGRLNAQQVKNI